MSSARDRAAALRKRDAPPPPADDDASRSREPSTRQRPVVARKVRQTVDLTGDAHQALATWRLETALALGRTRLTTQDVLAACVAVLLEDDQVSRRVRARLETEE